MAIFGVSCATTTAPKNGGWAIEQPYHRELAGVGGGAIVGSILIRGNEVAAATQALVAALQAQQLSVKTPALALDAIIPVRVPWTTDIAPIAADVVAAHNASFPQMQLRPAYYGVSYSGLHDTSGNAFRYRVSAKLYERGALSGWTAVRDDRYSGNFFVQRLVAAIQKTLAETAAAQ